jgi:thiamine-phosphate pyrophosphorylase
VDPLYAIDDPLMLPDLTPAASRALNVAQLVAARDGSIESRPGDLLFGLLQEEEGRAAALVAGTGCDLAALRTALGCESNCEFTASAGLVLHADSQIILDAAVDLAAEWTGMHTVGSDALLTALLRHDAACRGLLERHGLKMDKLIALLPAAKPPLLVDESLFLDEPTERIDLARILDASANRAREALRVVEDYCRFSLDDAFLSSETKQIRHDLAEALADVPASLLLAARETQRDVGTRIGTASEQNRHSAKAVVQANLKRLQEALRSLEEHGKILNPRLGGSMEQLRYRTYTLERSILLGADAREKLADAKLYVLLTGSLCAASLDWTIQEAAAGGATMYQLREKTLDDRTLLERARNVRRWTRQASAIFIVNDRPDIARLAEADGVHLGQNDMPIKEARRIFGPDAIIGVSTHDIDQLRQAIRDGASYVGVGPTFPSNTKDFAEFAGLEFVRQATAETSLPMFVIGGVNEQTIGDAVLAGARRVAVSHAVCRAEDPRAAAAALVGALGSGQSPER